MARMCTKAHGEEEMPARGPLHQPESHLAGWTRRAWRRQRHPQEEPMEVHPQDTPPGPRQRTCVP